MNLDNIFRKECTKHQNDIKNEKTTPAISTHASETNHIFKFDLIKKLNKEEKNGGILGTTSCSF